MDAPEDNPDDGYEPDRERWEAWQHEQEAKEEVIEHGDQDASICE